jgi:hypothetical protein
MKLSPCHRGRPSITQIFDLVKIRNEFNSLESSPAGGRRTHRAYYGLFDCSLIYHLRGAFWPSWHRRLPVLGAIGSWHGSLKQRWEELDTNGRAQSFQTIARLRQLGKPVPGVKESHLSCHIRNRPYLSANAPNAHASSGDLERPRALLQKDLKTIEA